MARRERVCSSDGVRARLSLVPGFEVVFVFEVVGLGFEVVDDMVDLTAS